MTRILLLCLALSLTSGCSINRFTANTTANLFGEASVAFNEESDLTLAREAMPANLKMLEGLQRVSPENKTLLVLLAQGYCSYTFAFLDDSANPADLNRAKDLYIRGYHYALAALPEEIRKTATGGLEDLEKAVSKLDGDDIAPLFWAAYCLGDWVNLNKNDVSAVGELSRTEIMMRQVLAKDEKFYNAGVHQFYGIYFGSRPKMLGGNPTKAKEHLDRAIQLTNGKFLLAKLFMAQFYAVPTQNEELFDSLIKQIAEAPDNFYPAEALANQVAKNAQPSSQQAKAIFSDEVTEWGIQS